MAGALVSATSRWRNMRGGWTQNATQGFKTRALARAACGLRPIDPTRPHLRWYAGRVVKVQSASGGHHWSVSHFVKTVTVDVTTSHGVTFIFTALGQYGPYTATVVCPGLGEWHHIVNDQTEWLDHILNVGATGVGDDA